MTGDRPYIHINCASTIDGKIALPDGGRLRISTEWDLTRVHRLRATLGAVMVGAGTIIADDPKLTVNKDHAGENATATKIVLDGAGRIPPSARFLKTEGPSIVVTTEACSQDWIHSLREAGSTELSLLVLPGGPHIDPGICFQRLFRTGINGILVEGGSETIARIIATGSFDLFTIFYGAMMMGGSGPTIVGGPGFTGGPVPLKLTSLQRPKGGGLLVEYEPLR